jgi:hypothetical protein
MIYGSAYKARATIANRRPLTYHAEDVTISHSERNRSMVVLAVRNVTVISIQMRAILRLPRQNAPPSPPSHVAAASDMQACANVELQYDSTGLS